MINVFARFSNHCLNTLVDTRNVERSMVFSFATSRHRRFGEATRACVKAWGLELVCKNDAAHRFFMKTMPF